MEQALKYIKIIGWESIILGSFLMVKIPEAIVTFLFQTEIKEQFLNKNMTANTTQVINSFSFFTVSLIFFSLLLIIGGAFLLKRKQWARSWLLVTYGFLGIIVFSTLIQQLIALFKLQVQTILFAITISPFLLLLLIILANIFMLKNKKLKQLL